MRAARPRPRQPRRRRRRHARARRINATTRVTARIIARTCVARMRHSIVCHPEPRFPLVVPPVVPHARAQRPRRPRRPRRRPRRPRRRRHTARVASMTRWRVSARIIMIACDARVCHSYERYPEPPLPSRFPLSSPTRARRGGGGSGGAAAAARRAHVASMTRRRTPSPASSRASETRACISRARVIPNPASLSSSPPSSPTRARPRPPVAAAAAARGRGRGRGGGGTRARVASMRGGARHRVPSRVPLTRACVICTRIIPNSISLSSSPPSPPHARALGRARAAAPILRGQRHRLRVGARLGRRRWWRRRRRWHAQAIWGGGAAAARPSDT